MKITVTFTVEADVEGWAKVRGIPDDYAQAEIVDYLANIAPDRLKGQTFLAFESVTTDVQ